MRRILRYAIALTVILLSAQPAYTLPRFQAFFGTATTTNATVSTTFYPARICIRNADATNLLYADFIDGVAIATTGGTNFKLAIGQQKCFDLNDTKSPTGTLDIGVLAGAATALYEIEAIR